ncbi:RagB/SusD family nutrient uptake outer membrane protein [Carboxylicivirga sp. RSCT41]|uniref:RagB/SusD family nutrient uptake outer membrane protein n=1 Tax=Carboxylicivirga agarovorans TaxID=3417570 RepID=UPI003D32EE4F
MMRYLKNISGVVHYFLLLVLVSQLSSCSSFLEETPTDRYVVGNFYNDADDAEAAVNAIYGQLYKIYKRHMYLMADLPTDDHKNGLGMPNSYLINLEYLRHGAENQFVREMWQYNYEGIMMANAAVINIQAIKMDENLKDRLLAEARFLRALYYFNLVRFYGDVPLIEKLFSLTNIEIDRTPKEIVYDFIVDDLQFAEQMLPIEYWEAEQGRVTKGAAKILMAKVYLTRKQFKAAADKLYEVVEHENEYNYGLHENYKANWEEISERGKESVFSIEYDENGVQRNNQMALCGPRYSIHQGAGVPGLKNANEADIPTVELFNAFKESDGRKYVTFKLEYLSPADGEVYTSRIPLFGKYWEDGQTALNRSSVNMHILRYADALLMYAEALNELGHTELAVSCLNRVRYRAFKDESENYTGLDQESFRLAVWNERRLELALEGHRWFDLVRTDRLVERMRQHGSNEAILAEDDKTEISSNIKEHMVLMPIPQYERNLNPKLEQNPGY